MNKEAQNLETQLESTASSTALGPMATVSVEIANTLMNRSPAHLVLIDQQDNIVDVNARVERLLDKSATDLRGSTPTHIFERILERVATIGPEKAARGFQIQFDKAWYEAQVFETRVEEAGKDGHVYRVVRATDVTDRKSAEFELLESEARLEEATRIARMGTYRLYWDTMKVIWSHQMYEIHGLNPGNFDPAVTGYNDYVHPQDVQTVKSLVRDLVSGKELSGFEYRIIRPNGEERWVRLDGRVLFEAEGTPYATFGTLQDITEAKMREEELKDLVSRNTILTEALQASPIGVAILTSESESPTIFYVNSALEEITGYGSGGLIGAQLDILKGYETEEYVYQEIIDAIQMGEPR